MQNWIQVPGSSENEFSWHNGKRIVNYDFTGLSEDDQLKKALSITLGGEDGDVDWDKGWYDESDENGGTEAVDEEEASEADDEYLELEFEDAGAECPDLGDYIETYYDAPNFQGGTIVGIIKNAYGEPVCYKVWTHMVGDWKGFDYIQADKVYLHEPYGSVDAGLASVGYEYIDDDSSLYGGYFYNKETGDKVFW